MKIVSLAVLALVAAGGNIGCAISDSAKLELKVEIQKEVERTIVSVVADRVEKTAKDLKLPDAIVASLKEATVNAAIDESKKVVNTLVDVAAQKAADAGKSKVGGFLASALTFLVHVGLGFGTKHEEA